jgi:hypothetical protein
MLGALAGNNAGLQVDLAEAQVVKWSQFRRRAGHFFEYVVLEQETGFSLRWHVFAVEVSYRLVA